MELAMALSHSNLIPAVFLQYVDDVTHFHYTMAYSTQPADLLVDDRG